MKQQRNKMDDTIAAAIVSCRRAQERGAHDLHIMAAIAFEHAFSKKGFSAVSKE
jgi:hypothetical protein